MKNLLCMSTLCALLSACGGSGISAHDGKVNVETLNTVPTLQGLNVRAESSTNNGLAVINSGDFTVEWDAVAVNSSTLNLYLSQDAIKSDADIDLFFTINPQGNSKARFKWNDEAESISVSSLPVPVKSFFNDNPNGFGFVIARACGLIIDTAYGERKSCVEKAVPVQLVKTNVAAATVSAAP